MARKELETIQMIARFLTNTNGQVFVPFTKMQKTEGEKIGWEGTIRS